MNSWLLFYSLASSACLVFVLAKTIQLQQLGHMKLTAPSRSVYLSMYFSMFCTAVGQAAVWPLTLLSFLVSHLAFRLTDDSEPRT